MMNSFSVRTRSGIGRRQRFIESIPLLPPTTSLASRTSISISFFFLSLLQFQIYLYTLYRVCAIFFINNAVIILYSNGDQCAPIWATRRHTTLEWHMRHTISFRFHFFHRILFSLFVCFVFGRHLFVLVADQQLLFSIIIDTLNMWYNDLSTSLKLIYILSVPVSAAGFDRSLCRTHALCTRLL